MEAESVVGHLLAVQPAGEPQMAHRFSHQLLDFPLRHAFAIEALVKR